MRFQQVLMGIGVSAVLAWAGFGCSHPTPRHLSPDYGQCCQSGFAAQVVNPDGPNDPSPPNSLPGDIAIQLYEQKYIKSLMEKKDKDEDVASALSNVD